MAMAHALRNPAPAEANEFELHAYNAAFYELGLRWHWDADTHEQLLQESADAGERLRIYLTRIHPHLLRAYDADFLIAAIEAKKAQHLKSMLAAGPASCSFDWADSLGAELGA
jgi:hypothetical protein